MKLKIGEVIKFGKFRGLTIEEVLIEEDDYINWMIGNFEDLEIHPDFIENAVKINPTFKVSEKHLISLEEKIKTYKTNNKEEFSYENFEKFIENKDYEMWLNLTDEEKEPYMKEYMNQLDLIIEREILKRKSKNVNRDNHIRIDYNEIFNDDKICRDDETDWSNYDENLGFGEQSEEFWNQF